MGLRDAIERILSRSARPTAPAKSRFGAGAAHDQARRRAKNEFDLEVEKSKGRPRGF